MIRDDLSTKLIHLTRGDSKDPAAAFSEAASRFIAIAQERRLRGGTGFIKGSYRCVCFTEAPISKLTRILASGPAEGLRYAPFGVIIDKQWLFEQGARPVIYGPDPDFDKLPEEMRYRHVRFWLSDEYSVDHTWEREWRLHADELPLDPGKVTLVVPDRLARKRFTEQVSDEWHLMVLEDLGVQIPRER